MSGCPVHIWVPMMAAALPLSRAVRDRVRHAASALLHRTPAQAPAPREVHRWAPVASTPVPAEDAPRP